MMKTLYLDCGMGAAGDMLAAALYELLDDEDRSQFIDKINSIGIPKVEFCAKKSVKCGIVGTHMSVKIDDEEETAGDYDHHNHQDHDHHHHDHDHHDHDHDHEHNHDHHDHDHDHDHHLHHHNHSSLGEISEIVEKFDIPKKVKEDVINVYTIIANAESKVHGVSIKDIHFHEVGTIDAVADVTAVCFLMDMISPDKIVASPVHVGSGHVHCAHGILPVPAPATANILEEVPIYGGGIKGELCTPTGAALLKYFVTDFSDMPVMSMQSIGYGMGKKDFSVANCVRAMLGNTANTDDTVVELCCNIDDMSAERIGYAMDILLSKGALDVYTIAAGMKKSRPGVILCVMCKTEQKEEIVKLIFEHTTTIGIRENILKRYTLKRSVESIETSVGTIRIKRSEGYGVTRAKIEYDDLVKIANEKGISIDEVSEIIRNERK